MKELVEQYLKLKEEYDRANKEAWSLIEYGHARHKIIEVIHQIRNVLGTDKYYKLDGEQILVVIVDMLKCIDIIVFKEYKETS